MNWFINFFSFLFINYKDKKYSEIKDYMVSCLKVQNHIISYNGNVMLEKCKIKFILWTFTENLQSILHSCIKLILFLSFIIFTEYSIHCHGKKGWKNIIQLIKHVFKKIHILKIKLLL